MSENLDNLHAFLIAASFEDILEVRRWASRLQVPPESPQEDEIQEYRNAVQREQEQYLKIKTDLQNAIAK